MPFNLSQCELQHCNETSVHVPGLGKLIGNTSNGTSVAYFKGPLVLLSLEIIGELCLNIGSMHYLSCNEGLLVAVLLVSRMAELLG